MLHTGPHKARQPLKAENDSFKGLLSDDCGNGRLQLCRALRARKLRIRVVHADGEALSRASHKCQFDCIQ